MADIRATFAETLTAAAQRDSELVTVVNDSVGSSYLHGFQQRFPARLFNVGIAEQNLVGFAAGLAAAGLKPWVCSAACFLSWRATEQIRNDVIYSRHNVKLVANTSGVDYGPLGVTHYALADMGLYRAFPNFYVVIPADHEETEAAVQTLLSVEEPAYLRLYRGDVPHSLNMPGDFRLGKIRVLRKGRDCAVFASGRMVARVLEAADQLKKAGYSISVVNVSTLSPIDVSGVVEVAAETSCAVTVEEHAVQTALGSAVSEVLSEHNPMPVLRLGFPSAFSIAGPPEAIRAHYGLTVNQIRDSIRSFIEQCNAGKF
ncbi:MAG: transketolase family protein [Firmicutes bacterium]|jgi:transketolase|nr:transketolase family protein [Bacillota bacterium]